MIKEYIKIVFQEFGFESPSEFPKAVIGSKYLIAEAILTTGVVFWAFVKDWLWDPPGAAIFLLVLIIVESITGATVAIVIKKEKFNPKKLYRSVPVLVSHILVLVIIHNIAKFEPTLFFLQNAVFAWFSIRNGLSIISDLVQLKLINVEFLSFFKDKIASKINNNQTQKK